MPKPIRRPNSFTLVEVLTVIAIIAVLVGLLLGAVSGLMRTSSRERARAEVHAIGAALESYRADNGSYPIPPTGTGFNSTNDYATAVPSLAGGLYQTSSAYLYQQLTGRTLSTDAVQVINPATPGQFYPIYMAFKSSQLGNNFGGGNIYIKDPFGNSYGYFAGNPNVSVAGGGVPVSGTNQYDLFSTGGDTNSPPVTSSWINNWSN